MSRSLLWGAVALGAAAVVGVTAVVVVHRAPATALAFVPASSSPDPQPSSPAPASSPSASASAASPPYLAAVESFIGKRPGYLGMEIRDRQTGRVWRAGATDHLVWTASTVKLGMAVSLLERSRAGQVTLDATARSQIADMLNWSSDNAADALWFRYGGDAFIPRFQSVYGMRRLTFISGFQRYWGHMKCTPDDLAALMSYILTTLNPTDRAYIVSAMRSVGPVQRWGVWGAGPSLRPGNKDGWSVEPDSDGMHWVTNTVGFLGPDERYIVAVMYQLPASLGTGSAAVHTGGQAISDLVATAFGSPVPATVSVPSSE